MRKAPYFSFRLEQGTRQTYPVRSLLVAICIEPLSQWIIQNRNIRGTVMKGGEQKISLFVVKVLVYLSALNNHTVTRN